MPSSVDLICVDPARVHEFWPFASGLIKTAIERTGLSAFEDIEKQVLAGEQLLWLAWSEQIEAAATTHLSRGVCTLTACSGHQRERWLPLFATIEKYAKDEGCSTLRLYGRKGWERVLDGYRVEHVILEKGL
ncbi:hypothetical protein ABIF38_005268 [Bradyrhizobium japonicum]|uniref:hypothetical protein n=1 Tax=Bradyrhizobium elkanii TaxID=29448 RepID=UPI00037FEC8A|nr:hypothetical protein [Bradyrhizobium elkanii]MCP1732420.1 hypothetical protein [Bradyrhizobium elkanii]MCS3567758.1 hypothetical protein [Bradyrhizobium elkanii]MCS3590759.1 hypothetical protein [Bradyrhizobium elkanii]MCS3620202.1 hypothetical protein [Bradyrhizobium elkanii]GEC56777.1 hypothetical protein BEL01nite_58200 [Bradyrhizobium elkanii]